MTWLDTLNDRIADAYTRFPPQLDIASLSVPEGTFLIASQALQDMLRMGLGDLPVSTVALPYDLSSILTRPHHERMIRDDSHHLSDYFPNFFVAAIYELQSLFASYHHNAFIIGGITHDMLLSSERQFDISDVDIIVEGQALDAARYVNQASRNFQLEQEFAAFGTAKLRYKDQIDVDFASTRQEIYRTCGALPEIVAMGVPLESDIIRRDFTVNALALSIVKPGQILDCTSGLDDLQTRQIRLLKVPSFFEDPSRILRALRFAIALDFSWSADTDYLLDRFLLWMPDIYKGGGERIREELSRLLSQPESPVKVRWLEFLVQKKLTRLIDTQLVGHAELPIPLAQFSQRLTVLENALADYWSEDCRWQVYLNFLMMGLPEAPVKMACHRLGLTRPEIEGIEHSMRLLHENTLATLTENASPTALYDAFHPLHLSAACIGILLSPSFESALAAFYHYKHSLEPIKLDVNGIDVLNLGVPQGEQVGKLLKSLLYDKLEGRVQHRVDELTWLKNAISQP